MYMYMYMYLFTYTHQIDETSDEHGFLGSSAGKNQLFINA